jgi:hypothetical protein
MGDGDQGSNARKLDPGDEHRITFAITEVCGILFRFEGDVVRPAAMVRLSPEFAEFVRHGIRPSPISPANPHRRNSNSGRYAHHLLSACSRKSERADL